MSKTRGKLKPEDAYRLTANYSYLIKEIDAEYLVDDLFSQFVLDDDDKAKILSRTTARERTRVMLDKLLNSGPGDAYNIFIEILTKAYPEAADKLKATVVEIPSKPDYSWYDNLPDAVKNRVVTQADASRISSSLGANWKHVMLLLGLRDVEIQQELMSQPHAAVSSIVTALLIKWMHRNFRQATVDKLVSVLKNVNEDGSCLIDWEIVENALNNS